MRLSTRLATLKLQALVISAGLIFAQSGQLTAGADTEPSDQAKLLQPSDLPNPMRRVAKSSLELAYTLGYRISEFGIISADGVQTPGPEFAAVFEQEIVRIPMRDGIELHTEIYRPRDQREPLPIILERTPYRLNHTDNGYSARLRLYPELIKDGYIFVLQGIRGRNASDGGYVSLKPMRNPDVPGSTDDSTDAYDTIDWLVNNVENTNRRVGMLGISYGAFLTTRALIDPHPALRAASPQATCAEMFIGDDWHHNGAFRLDYSFGWIGGMEQGISRGGSVFGRYDNYEAFMALGPLSNVNKKIFHGRASSWNAFTEHPNQDDYWREEMCGVLPFIQPVTVLTLNVTGWFDAEDFYGPIEVYKKYESTDKDDLNYMVLGPWFRGGWARSSDGRLGAVDFGSNTAGWYRAEIQAPWFAHWLKDHGDLDQPEILAFRTGSNHWERFDKWPPEQGIERRNLYLHESGGLSFMAQTKPANKGYDDYISDPANPVPYRHRPIRHSNGWSEWQLEDQRLADGRPDVLTYISKVLEADLTITGEPIAHLFAATSGSDSDWVVKLIDVYPEQYEPEPYMGGFQFMVAGEIFRGRYGNSFEQPEAIVTGKVTPYEINLRSRNHTFKAGHRIMVQVQSSWFPLIDRNPQTYVDSIYDAVEEDFQVATQSAYRTPGFPSHSSLPININ